MLDVRDADGGATLRVRELLQVSGLDAAELRARLDSAGGASR